MKRTLLVLAAVVGLLLGTEGVANAGYSANCVSSSRLHTGIVKVHTSSGESPLTRVTSVEATHTASGFSNFQVTWVSSDTGKRHTFNRNTNKTYSVVTLTAYPYLRPFQDQVHWTLTWTGSDGYKCGR